MPGVAGSSPSKAARGPANRRRPHCSPQRSETGRDRGGGDARAGRLAGCGGGSPVVARRRRRALGRGERGVAAGRSAARSRRKADRAGAWRAGTGSYATGLPTRHLLIRARAAGCRSRSSAGCIALRSRDFLPDLTMILDLPVEIGLARAAARAGTADRFERLDHGFHERLRQGFEAIAAAEPTRCVLIDAAPEPKAVQRVVWAAVEARLGAALP